MEGGCEGGLCGRGEREKREGCVLTWARGEEGEYSDEYLGGERGKPERCVFGCAHRHFRGWVSE